MAQWRQPLKRGYNQTGNMNGNTALAIYLLSNFRDFLAIYLYGYEFSKFEKKILSYVVNLLHTGKTALEGIFLIFGLRKYTFIITKFCAL